MTQLEFKTEQEAKEKAESSNKIQTEEDLKSYLNAKKFCYYQIALDDYWNKRICDPTNAEFGNADNDLDSNKAVFSNLFEPIMSLIEKHSVYIIRNAVFASLTDEDKKTLSNKDSLYSCVINMILCMSLKKRRDFYIGTFMKLIKLRIECCLRYMRVMMIEFCYLLPANVILCFLSSEERYNFFQQFHHMLEKNIPTDDKLFFYNYLKLCKDKLQNEKNNYRIFNRPVRNLIWISIFGVIASATVLTIYFMGIYVATWFFWFGILGVVLTVLVGIRLGYFLFTNYNKVKTINRAINRAIEVFDLDKIKNLEKPKAKKISMLEMGTDKTILSNKTEEIDTETDKRNDNPYLSKNTK